MYIGFLRQVLRRTQTENSKLYTFVHLDMSAEFLVCAKGLGALSMITLIWLCPGWSVFTSQMGTQLVVFQERSRALFMRALLDS
jgi:hypothetical protein